jgi:uncharacterized protein (TIGR00299 family) protein
VTGRVGWLDLSCGASGDMLLGALVGAGVPLAVLADAVAALDLPLQLHQEQVQRAGLAATRVVVDAPEAGQPHRTWREVQGLLTRLPDALHAPAHATFAALASAEGKVHGVDPADVHFHEVGALDALADVVGVCAGFVHLGLDALTASPVALGGGSVRAGHGDLHGKLPVPGPAVLALLAAAGAPASGGPVDVELCTPTGAALVTALATSWGTLPSMEVDVVGSGAGTRDLPGRPNVVRLVLGAAAHAAGTPVVEPAILLETNVDDLDPRVWPAVLARLMAAGASDAWLSPILMKKGRPAHTLSVLCPPAAQTQLVSVVLQETPSLGIRVTRPDKFVAGRRMTEVVLDGQPIAVKVGLGPAGEVLTATPEWDDVAATAQVLGRPVREVLARAAALATALVRGRQSGAAELSPPPE